MDSQKGIDWYTLNLLRFKHPDDGMVCESTELGKGNSQKGKLINQTKSCSMAHRFLRGCSIFAENWCSEIETFFSWKTTPSGQECQMTWELEGEETKNRSLL
ncbi:hypothetical protein AVEN_53352-1 [Araneus ventricosus]|uniref:Uncharacterized protein n=1 Tax=Araneus ventricosus TaxID=182803 RepID=A0A4Y2AA23_ARAVE|nr:hypothetical protein AVEN_53352-1 [Araneus ventricosus]